MISEKSPHITFVIHTDVASVKIPYHIQLTEQIKKLMSINIETSRADFVVYVWYSCGGSEITDVMVATRPISDMSITLPPLVLTRSGYEG